MPIITTIQYCLVLKAKSVLSLLNRSHINITSIIR